MEKNCLVVFLLLQTVAAEAIGVGVGVGVGIDIGGGIGDQGTLCIGGENNPQNPPYPSGSSNSKLKRAHTALQAWKSAITDDPYGFLDSWVGSDVCSYKGVFCVDPQDEFGDLNEPVVAGIDLNHANLKGSLVKQLSLLKDISILHLNSNRFKGKVPSIFKNFTSLTELDLSNNCLSGPFPNQTLSIPHLKYLDLRFNNFSGPIPRRLFDKRLDAIFLNNNQFNGRIPANLGNSPASVINLANNKFSGEIPFGFGYKSPKLQEILFINNRLTGCIPEAIGLWKELEVLDVSFNSLVGRLPDSLSCLKDIEVLNFRHNKLSGVLPDSVCSLKRLQNLTVAGNFFSGVGHNCTKSSHRAVEFDFSLNCIHGKGRQRPAPQCSCEACSAPRLLWDIGYDCRD